MNQQSYLASAESQCLNLLRTIRLASGGSINTNGDETYSTAAAASISSPRRGGGLAPISVAPASPAFRVLQSSDGSGSTVVILNSPENALHNAAAAARNRPRPRELDSTNARPSSNHLFSSSSSFSTLSSSFAPSQTAAKSSGATTSGSSSSFIGASSSRGHSLHPSHTFQSASSQRNSLRSPIAALPKTPPNERDEAPPGNQFPPAAQSQFQDSQQSFVRFNMPLTAASSTAMLPSASASFSTLANRSQAAPSHSAATTVFRQSIAEGAEMEAATFQRLSPSRKVSRNAFYDASRGLERLDQTVLAVMSTQQNIHVHKAQTQLQQMSDQYRGGGGGGDIAGGAPLASHSIREGSAANFTNAADHPSLLALRSALENVRHLENVAAAQLQQQQQESQESRPDEKRSAPNRTMSGGPPPPRVFASSALPNGSSSSASSLSTSPLLAKISQGQVTLEQATLSHTRDAIETFMEALRRI